MKEQKVIRNESKEYYIVKVNDLFASGWNSSNTDPIKLNMLEYDASKYEKLEVATDIAKKINGDIFKVIEVEIKTRSYDKLVK